MTIPQAEYLDVPVAGGDLRVARWGAPLGDAPVVLAAHGISASHLNWSRVAEALGDDVTLLAPDLRGRGASGELPGPYSMAAHATDVVAVLDHLGIDQALFVGHSMGAFVAVVAGARFPDRFSGLLLIDGGLKLADLPPGVSVDDALEAIIGPAMQRLKMTFPTRQAYRDFWKVHPALAADWDAGLEAYVDYDLTGAEPALRSRASLEAVRGDAADTLVNTEVHDAPGRATCPVRLVRASHGMLGDAPGLYPDDSVRPALGRFPAIADERIDGVNHYTITMGTRGAAAIADRIREMAKA